jgi:EAL domain-containing protein (putative c-di-GMP-specific phosphodiesterase class I)
MDDRLQQRVKLEGEIKSAIAKGEIVLYYQKMVEAIVSLAHALGLGITAEGIETEALRDRLIELGCESGQGYLFGRPEPFATALSASPDYAEVARLSA